MKNELLRRIRTKEALIGIKNSDYKTLFENFFALSIMQTVNKLLPFITFPYLVRILGASNFGLVSFSQSFIQYFVIFTDYGFNLSATRNISQNKKYQKNISKIFSTVIVTKFLLMILSLFVMLFIIVMFSKFRNDYLLYIYTFGIVIGQAMFPVWFFQGMEKMKYIALINLFAKIISTISIFCFIREKSDYIYVPLINSIGMISAGILSLFLISRFFKINFSLPSISMIKECLKNGYYVFLSSMSISILSISNTFILGLFASNMVVGLYSIAEKIVRLIHSFLGIISQTIYPYICKINKNSAVSFLKKISVLLIIGGTILSAILYLFSTNIINIISNKNFYSSAIVLKILSLLPLIIVIRIPLSQLMLKYKMDSIFARCFILASIINIILNFVLAPIFLHIGSAITLLVTEISTIVFMAYYLIKSFHLRS